MMLSPHASLLAWLGVSLALQVALPSQQQPAQPPAIAQ
jgi:hypothetical protein